MHPTEYAAGFCTAAANDDEPPVRLPLPLGLALGLSAVWWIAVGALVVAVVL